MKDGGQAFPVPQQLDGNDQVITYADSGMTVRDYFAAHAPITLADIPDQQYSGVGTSRDIPYADRLAKLAERRWQYADAMLTKREKPE